MKKRLCLTSRLASMAVVVTVAAGGLMATSAPAAAAPDFQLPFPAGRSGG